MESSPIWTLYCSTQSLALIFVSTWLLSDDLYPTHEVGCSMRMLSASISSRVVHVGTASSHYTRSEKCLHRCRTCPGWGSIGSPLKSRRPWSSSWCSRPVQFCVSDPKYARVHSRLCLCCNNSDWIVHSCSIFHPTVCCPEIWECHSRVWSVSCQ